MIRYISVPKFSEIHSISKVTIRKRILEGEIMAIKVNGQWWIPIDTPKPRDRRVKLKKI